MKKKAILLALLILIICTIALNNQKISPLFSTNTSISTTLEKISPIAKSIFTQKENISRTKNKESKLVQGSDGIWRQEIVSINDDKWSNKTITIANKLDKLTSEEIRCREHYTKTESLDECIKLNVNDERAIVLSEVSKLLDNPEYQQWIEVNNSTYQLLNKSIENQLKAINESLSTSEKIEREIIQSSNYAENTNNDNTQDNIPYERHITRPAIEPAYEPQEHYKAVAESKVRCNTQTYQGCSGEQMRYIQSMQFRARRNAVASAQMEGQVRIMEREATNRTNLLRARREDDAKKQQQRAAYAAEQQRKEERRARRRADVESTYYVDHPDGTTSEMRVYRNYK